VHDRQKEKKSYGCWTVPASAMLTIAHSFLVAVYTGSGSKWPHSIRIAKGEIKKWFLQTNVTSKSSITIQKREM
jgi:hypothetical protein